MRLKKNYVVCFFVLLALTLSACKSAYVPYDYKLDKYITLGEYTGIRKILVNHLRAIDGDDITAKEKNS